jgi:hypothetical protein
MKIIPPRYYKSLKFKINSLSVIINNKNNLKKFNNKNKNKSKTRIPIKN